MSPPLGQGPARLTGWEEAPPPWGAVTLSIGRVVVGEQLVLPVAQHEGQEGQDEGISDAEDGQHEGPADGAVAQRVLARLLPAHAPHLTGVPAVGVDQAANHQACG